MLELIAMLEAATGPDERLDFEILLACGWQHEWCVSTGETTGMNDPAGVEYYLEDLPKVTSSIDAALTLVPESCDWTLEKDFAVVRWLSVDDVDEAKAGFNGRSGTCTPLAICIAALKARHALSSNVRGPLE